MWAANCPSTCGFVRIRPWWSAGLSVGGGVINEEERAGSFLIKEVRMGKDLRRFWKPTVS